jgi:hypothetical protein
MEGLDKRTLVELFQIYENALLALQELGDPALIPLIKRLARRRAEVLGALAHTWHAADPQRV